MEPRGTPQESGRGCEKWR